jgi:exodeoxyribonuclease-3
MRLVSWNVNGLRAAANKGFPDWLGNESADVVGVQETRATEAQIPENLRTPTGFHTHFVAAERGGYSGVGLYARRPFELLATGVGVRSMDVEGRLQLVRVGALTIANVYFPNGSGPDHDNSRVPFKLRFYRRLYALLAPLVREGAPVVVMGDFNTAPEEIDLARPKENAKTSGFLPEERQEILRWKKLGWVDSYRAVHPERQGEYSWWSQRFGVRERNVGWRIDLALLSPAAARHLRDAAIDTKVMGSDHCPISVELDDRVMG